MKIINGVDTEILAQDMFIYIVALVTNSLERNDIILMCMITVALKLLLNIKL